MKTAAKMLTVCVALGLVNPIQSAWGEARAITAAIFVLGQYSPDSAPPARSPFDLRPDTAARRDASRFPATDTAPPTTRNSAFNDRVVTNPQDLPPSVDPFPAGRGGPSADLRGAVAGNASKKAQANAFLHLARVELARRSTRTAAEYVARAKSVGALYNLLDDSPPKIEALIRKANQFAAGPRPGDEASFARQFGQFLMEQADGLLRYNDFQRAEALALEAKNLRADFGQFQRTPDQLLAQITELKQGAAAGGADSSLAANNGPAGASVRQADYVDSGNQFPVNRSAYNPARDRSRTVAAAYEDDGPAASETSPAGPANDGDANDARQLYEHGMHALGERDRAAALEYFRQAWRHREQLDPQTQQDLQDKLNSLQPVRSESAPRDRQNPLNGIESEKQIALQKLQREVFGERAAAEQMRARDPRGALARLNRLRDHVAESQVDEAAKKQWLNVVGRSIVDTERYIQQNLAQIENDEINRSREEDVEQRQQGRSDLQNELAILVEKFNKLMDENRYYEAVVIARQAMELAPDEPVVQTLKWKAEFAKRYHDQNSIRDRAERETVGMLESVDESGIPFDDRDPYRFPAATTWRELTDSRARQMREGRGRVTPEEMRIHQTLRDKKVEVRFTRRPLQEVLDYLGDQAGMNIHLDQQGLIAEGATSDTPVTINLNQPISLRSALNLILDDLNLGYVVQNEVVKVTSVSMKDQSVFQKTYYVADLVIPIPNFVPSYNIGLPGALAASYQSLAGGGTVPTSGTVPLTVAQNPDYANPTTTNPQVLANVGRGSMANQADIPRPMGYTPGGLGGGPIADFDSLIELITSTIAPDSWDEVGGPGSVSGFETNLSLVVSQTQEVHDQIADLLEQLRRLQDLQVTIEVRFIQLLDSFAEQIGVDFDFDIDDNSGFVGNQDPTIPFTGAFPQDDNGPSITIGVGQNGVPTADLDLQFSQENLTLASNPFGPSLAGAGANFGFAILSDLEAFFFIQAAQADQRSNVLTAPKVTLFNGQSAVVSDTVQVPFVTSIIPVVGDFAAAHQPVIVVLSEGTSLSVQAVVSSDRRFVRLTLIPFFSQIGQVKEFTFDGKTTTRSGNFVQDPAGLGADDDFEVITEGTTVQLPEFGFRTVTTTVSVPDGGTVLLGGIKQLSEGRNEVGVPLLSKLPYINRLFKNVGIGRETRTLMMMVTPRIIIQEEEEERAVGRVLN